MVNQVGKLHKYENKTNTSKGGWRSSRSCFSAKGRPAGTVAPRGDAWFTSLGHHACQWETMPDPTRRPPAQTIDLSSKWVVPWGKWKWFSVWILTAGEWFLNSSPALGPTWTHSQISEICADEGAVHSHLCCSAFRRWREEGACKVPP